MHYMHFATCTIQYIQYIRTLRYAPCAMQYALCTMQNARCILCHWVNLLPELNAVFAVPVVCAKHCILIFERRQICKKLYFTLKNIFCTFLECILNNELAQSKLYTVQNLNAMTNCILQILCHCVTKFSCILCNNGFCEVRCWC